MRLYDNNDIADYEYVYADYNNYKLFNFITKKVL